MEPSSTDNGYPFDNIPDEAFHLDGRHGEPSLGKRESVAQGRWRCMQRPMTLPSSMSKAANRVVVPLRL